MTTLTNPVSRPNLHRKLGDSSSRFPRSKDPPDYESCTLDQPFDTDRNIARITTEPAVINQAGDALAGMVGDDEQNFPLDERQAVLREYMNQLQQGLLGHGIFLELIEFSQRRTSC